VLQLNFNRLIIITLQNSLQYRDISLHFVKSIPCWKCSKIIPVDHNGVYILCHISVFLYDQPCLRKLCTSVGLDSKPVGIHLPNINFPSINVTNKQAGFFDARSWKPAFYTVAEGSKPWLRFPQSITLKWALSLFPLCLCRCVFLSFLSPCPGVVALFKGLRFVLARLDLRRTFPIPDSDSNHRMHQAIVIRNHSSKHRKRGQRQYVFVGLS
jgi:hypothetical protein